MKLWLVINTIPNTVFNAGTLKKGRLRGNTIFKFHSVGATAEEAIARITMSEQPTLGTWSAEECEGGWSGGLR